MKVMAEIMAYCVIILIMAVANNNGYIMKSKCNNNNG
jgi:hypothetical protein